MEASVWEQVDEKFSKMTRCCQARRLSFSRELGEHVRLQMFALMRVR